MAKVELLYFAGCPAYRRARMNVLEAIAAAGPGLELTMVLVRHQADAHALDFHGSPTVRLDGKDIDPEGLARFPEVGLYSRSYRWMGREFDVPPPPMLRERLPPARASGA